VPPFSLSEGTRGHPPVLAPAIPASTCQRLAKPTAARHITGRMPKEPRKTITLRLSLGTISRLKRCARDAAGIPVFATTTGIAEAGINAECARIEAILRKAYPGLEGDDDPETPVRRTSRGRLPTINTHRADDRT